MVRVNVKPELIQWARQRSGRDNAYLDERFPDMSNWEAGNSSPTTSMLERFARSTRTPIGYFFLNEPPQERLPVSDFRVFGGGKIRKPSAGLLHTIYLCQQRQGWYRDEIRTSGYDPLEFVGSADMASDGKQIADDMRTLLKFKAADQAHADWTDALDQFIEQIESMGILVMISGVVGNSNRWSLDIDEFRGFALVDRWAPVIFVNGQDSRAAQMFTLAHELAHIWLGQSGISNYLLNEPSIAVETWCNGVAAELLVPSSMIQNEFDETAQLRAELVRLSRLFKVSTIVVLRRLHDMGYVNKTQFLNIYHKENDDWRDSNFKTYIHKTIITRTGRRFAKLLTAKTMEGGIPYASAMKLLGTKRAATLNAVAHELGVAS